MFRFIHLFSAVGLVLSLGLMGACSDDEDRNALPSIDGGPTPDADLTPRPDAGQILADAAMNSEGPVVEVLSPTAPATGDYSSGAIVTERRFAARCRAETNSGTGDKVDSTSVRMSATVGGASFEAVALPTSTPGEYEADMVVDGFPNGALSVRCTASDISANARENSEAISSFLDLGPTITILTPIADTSYANQADVAFTVEAAPVNSDDTFGTPDFANIVLQVSGVSVPVTNDNGLFSATIVFDDPMFDPVLDQEQTISVLAPNTRTTTATVREKNLVFNVDSEGPAISPITPLPGNLVAGILPITAEVIDPTGIMELSVIATIAGVHEVQLTSVNGDNQFTGSFDTRLLGPMVYPNIIIRARDATGNQSSYGYVVSLDNAPPMVSLDSPPMRESQKNGEGLIECSHQFDPLGRDAVSDGQTVPQLFEIRARLEDRSNTGTSNSGIVFPIASVDPSEVQFFVLDDASAALLVDTDSDGFCDEINPLLLPTSVPSASDEVAAFDLIEIPTTGASFFGTDIAPTFTDTSNDFCNAKDDDTAPDLVCSAVDMTRVIKMRDYDANVIFGIPPAVGNQCLGNAVDALATNISDGWSCMAVLGKDFLGNQNVSAPMRVCIDSDLSGENGCAAMGEIATTGLPNCTGTYDPETETVDTNTPCTANFTFPINEVRRIDL